jgi:hypothetical protein
MGRTGQRLGLPQSFCQFPSDKVKRLQDILHLGVKVLCTVTLPFPFVPPFAAPVVLWLQVTHAFLQHDLGISRDVGAPRKLNQNYRSWDLPHRRVRCTWPIALTTHFAAFGLPGHGIMATSHATRQCINNGKVCSKTQHERRRNQIL